MKEQTQKPLTVEVGRRVRYSGDMCNASGDGLIVAITGTVGANPARYVGNGIMRIVGNEARARVVLFDGRDLGAVSEHDLTDGRPFARLRMLDKVHGQQMIDAALRNVATVAAKRATDESIAKQKHADAVAALIAEHPHLSADGKYGKHAAANLRLELKRLVPHVKKVSVRSDATCINVRVPAGVSDDDYKQIERISTRFKLGHFDGMTDYYEYDRFNAWCDAFGGVKYVFVSRDRS